MPDTLPPPPSQIVPSELHTADSVHAVVRDSLNVTSATDVKDLITGENPLLYDALKSLIDVAVGFLPKLIGAVLVLWVGLKLVKGLKNQLTKLMSSRNVDMSLRGFLISLIDILLKILLIIMVMDIIGIKATSFIAIIGAAGLAIGMALQGTLQNFAGGVILLLLKPFKVGDYIETDKYKGWVSTIHIFHTMLRQLNGRIVIVPNSELATKTIVNHTYQPNIRMEINASVAYGTDSETAKAVLAKVCEDDELILKDPMYRIFVSELGDSSLDYTLWIWTTTDNYWTVWCRIRENIYKALNENNISIPFPQMDVHIDKTQPQQ